MKKEIPILFSTPMVQAILEGRKTMTRRIMKPQIEPCDHSIYQGADWKNEPTKWSANSLAKGYAFCTYCGNGVSPKNDHQGIRCPYGKPGDILWVRESWIDTSIPNCEPAGGIYFKADHPDDKRLRWKPSIHMPKDICRIWLEVTEVRVERLQEITEEDAIAEGVGTMLPHSAYPCERFKMLWHKINGEESWNANPWVWVVSFNVISTTGKPCI